ncbi:MAG: hypothetical protein JSU63_19050 [Phycisphaerales bacterium]|nr:MAG: hypothetical protein JSU63_19050 [Phycisphaerales bacterium]
MYRASVCPERAVQFHLVFLATAVGVLFVPGRLCADVFGDYSLTDSYESPQPESVFDHLPDGRAVFLHYADVYLESAVQSRSFTLLGTLPDADMPPLYSAAFIRVSPDGGKIAVGNNGGSDWQTYEVGVFDFPSLGGNWYSLDHWDAEWYDNTLLMITAGGYPLPSWVLTLNVTSGATTTVIGNIDGASAGITFDTSGNLYTGNGWTYGGSSGTGWVKAFEHELWTAALDQQQPLDFEARGVLVVDILSALSLGFDVEGNLYIGGGDAAGGDSEVDFVALISADAVGEALAGGGPANPDDPSEVRRFDPDATQSDNFYTVGYSSVTSELHLTDTDDGTVFVYSPTPHPVPAVSEWGLLAMTLVCLTSGTLMLRRGRSVPADCDLVLSAEPSASGCPQRGEAR